MSEKEKIFEKLANSVVTYNEAAAMAAVSEGLAAGIPAVDIVTKGLSIGIRTVGQRYGEGKVAIPFVMLAAKIMDKATKAALSKVPADQMPKPLATMVIGTVEGDIHDLGSNIVSAVFSASGFKVYNLGHDVPPETFIKKAEEVGANIIGASALMTNTLQVQKILGDKLTREGLREKYIYLVGGGAFPGAEWCEEIGADGFATDVTIGLEVAKKCVAERNK
ncbi:MAG: cobalamin-dependent protein [Candidatus Methanomethylicus sp.]|nr:cobalamin-dependent protein [Candidatus Methanomethylicus sp.]